MEDGTAPEMLVTHFVWRYRGRQTLKGVGRNPYLGGTTDGATEKALRRLQNSAESKRIVYYSFTNPAELAVQTVETPAVAIAFTAVEETSAMFLAQLLLDAAPDTGKVLTLTVRYYINDVPVEILRRSSGWRRAHTRWRCSTRLRRWRPGRSRGCRCGWSARAAR